MGRLTFYLVLFIAVQLVLLCVLTSHNPWLLQQFVRLYVYHTPLTGANTTDSAAVTQSNRPLSNSRAPHRKEFHPIMSETDNIVMRGLLQRFIQAVDQANLTYFMYGGTLLGSYRHHGPIPWDDDIDLIMPSVDRSKIRRTLSSLGHNLTVWSASNIRWKFYYSNSTAIKGVRWKYPFLDICFYKEDKTYIWDADPSFSKFKYRQSWIFPLIMRPFWNMSLAAPKDTSRTLLQNYAISSCQTNTYNHKSERFVSRKQKVTVNCNELWSEFPFVFRTETESGYNESLTFGKQVLNWAFIPK